jgi:hypothetical protein
VKSVDRFQLMTERFMLNLTRGAIIPEDTCALGLAGEVGEVCALLAAKPADAAMVLELGDVLWYITALAWHYDCKLADLIADAGDHYRADTANAVLSLVAHTGAVCDIIKKTQWHGKEPNQGAVLAGLRDAVAAIRVLAYRHGATLDLVMDANIAKLRARYPAGFVEGGGVR